MLSPGVSAAQYSKESGLLFELCYTLLSLLRHWPILSFKK